MAAAVYYRLFSAVVWAIYFRNDVDELDEMFERVGGTDKSQYHTNTIYLGSYKQIAANLRAGQPREEAIEDVKAILRNEKPVAPWSPASRKDPA